MVEEAVLAVGDAVGHVSVKSASWVNGVVVLFVDSTAKISEPVEKGVVIPDTFITASPLTNPATKVVISNAPLSRRSCPLMGLVSPVRTVLLGCKSPNTSQRHF